MSVSDSINLLAGLNATRLPSRHWGKIDQKYDSLRAIWVIVFHINLCPVIDLSRDLGWQPNRGLGLAAEIVCAGISMAFLSRDVVVGVFRDWHRRTWRHSTRFHLVLRGPGRQL